ncbi:MAG: serine/threonine-protein kinase [Cyanobacteria bacterium P01_H01_bin.150]
MICCLNPACHNPSSPDDTKFCISCGVPLVILRNRYRPVKFLGGGGFGKTYLAEDIDKLNEKCVIKQLAPQIQGSAGIEKATELFKQEAQRLQQLGEHPQIPTLLGYFEEDNRLYLIQQFIDGQNLLEELQQRGTFSEEKIRQLLQDLLSILKVVHNYKVIHRDIKPENIIVRQDGKVVLIDFGASKLLTNTVVTAQGTMIGSFGYASLEQMQGGVAYPATSDLYSLGATCFHLLSGIHPWELWRSQGYGWVKNWQQHVEQPITPQLSNILDKLLQEDYHQRYQSAQQVLQDLNSQQIKSNASVKTPVSPNQPLKNIFDAKKPQKLFLIAIPLMILIGGGAIYFQGLGNNSQAELAEPTPSAEPAAVEQKTAEDFYKAGIEKSNNEDFTGAIEDFTQAININPDYVIAYIRRGNAHNDLKDYQEAIKDYTQAIRINPNYALAYYNRGNVRRALRENKAAIDDYTEAIRLNPKNADAYNNRGIVYYDLEEYEGAIKDYTEAIKINPSKANAYNNRGNARKSSGDNKGAIKDYTEAIRINPNYAQAYYNRGNTHEDLGDNKAAIEDYTEAIRINPKYVNAYINRGLAYYNLKDYQTAIEDYTEAIKINPNNANAYYNLGLARSALGNKQAAIDDYRKAAELYNQQGKDSDYQDALKQIEKLEE